MSTEGLRRELHIGRAMDECMNDLVGEVQTLVDNARIWESRMEEAGVNNVVAVAQDTGSVEVVKNYIRYQVGRDTRNETWRWRVGGAKSFGERLVDALDGLHGRAQAIVSAAWEGEEEPPAGEVGRAWIQLTRSYLGHLKRYFVYRKKMSEAEQPREARR